MYMYYNLHTYVKYFSSEKRVVLALQMQVAEGGVPQKTASCHFPKSLWITFPLLSVMVPSTSFTLEFQYLACKGHLVGAKKKRVGGKKQESLCKDHNSDPVASLRLLLGWRFLMRRKDP